MKFNDLWIQIFNIRQLTFKPGKVAKMASRTGSAATLPHTMQLVVSQACRDDLFYLYQHLVVWGGNESILLLAVLIFMDVNETNDSQNVVNA